MQNALKYTALATFVLGVLLLSLGLAAKSDVTPVGQMDCGCGGGQECVTKNRAVADGFALSLAGGGFLLLGGIAGGAALLHRQRQKA